MKVNVGMRNYRNDLEYIRIRIRIPIGYIYSRNTLYHTLKMLDVIKHNIYNTKV